MGHYSIERFKLPVRDFILRHARGPYATWFLAFVSGIEAIISPIPVEAALAPLVVARPERWRFYAIVALFSSVAGALVAYAIGYALFDAIGASILSFYNLTDEMAVATELLRENMFLATFVAAFSPAPYKVFVFAAGALHGSLVTLIVASLAGRGLRFVIFSYLVYRFGGVVAHAAFRHFTTATVVIATLLLIAIGIWFF